MFAISSFRLNATGPDIDRLTAAYPEVFRNGSVRVFEIPDALPRAWAVHQVNQVAADDLLPALAAGSIDPKTTALMMNRRQRWRRCHRVGAIRSRSPTINHDQITLTAESRQRWDGDLE